MKVFLSWSGERSRLVATLLDEWLRCVLQAIRPWISTKDIDRGSLWFSEIQDQLQDVTTGIICLTQENKEKPWILFEAGALAKGLSNSRVCTLLIDLEPHDILAPLSQFNHTKPDRDGIYALVHTLNNRLGYKRLDQVILNKVLDTYWEQFEDKFKEIITATPPSEKPKARPEKDILAEILDHTRTLNSRLSHLERASEKQSNTRRSQTTPSELVIKDRQLLCLDMANNGATMDEISKELEMGIGEVMQTLHRFNFQNKNSAIDY